MFENVERAVSHLNSPLIFIGSTTISRRCVCSSDTPSSVGEISITINHEGDKRFYLLRSLTRRTLSSYFDIVAFSRLLYESNDIVLKNVISVSSSRQKDWLNFKSVRSIVRYGRTPFKNQRVFYWVFTNVMTNLECTHQPELPPGQRQEFSCWRLCCIQCGLIRSYTRHYTQRRKYHFGVEGTLIYLREPHGRREKTTLERRNRNLELINLGWDH